MDLQKPDRPLLWTAFSLYLILAFWIIALKFNAEWLPELGEYFRALAFDSSARPIAVKLEPAGGNAGVIEQLKISYYGNVPYIIWNPVAKEAVLLQYASSHNGSFTPGATEYLIGMMRVRTTGTMTESVLRSYYDMLEYGIEEDGVIVDATASYSYDSSGRRVFLISRAKKEFSFVTPYCNSYFFML